MANPLANPLDTPVTEESIKKLEVKQELMEKVEDNIKQDIPSCYIAIKLPSNGKIEGIPDVLHFRDYTGADALDLNVLDDDENIKTLVNVLKRMCYEKYDIGLLPVSDVLYILYILQFTFISSSIEKPIYLNENLPEGDKEGELDYVENIERVTIPFSALHVTFLGKDKNDKDLKENVKFPFTLTDSKTNDKIKVKLASLEDTLIAREYCKNFYKSKLIEFANVRQKLSEIQNIKKNSVREEKLNDYLVKNEDEINRYYAFMSEYALTVAKFIQALQIVSFNEEEITDNEVKWDLYQNRISSDMWQFYNQIVDERYSFGIDDEVEVYSDRLGKKVKRRIPFQLFDFISSNREQRIDRFSVSFD